jgi:hypothetical protein
MKFNHRIIDIIALIKNNNINAEFNKVNSVEGNSIEIGTKRIPIGRKYLAISKQTILNT